MIIDLQRIIKKGALDTLLDMKIIEFHKEVFDFDNRAIRLSYDITCYKIEDLEDAVPSELSDEKSRLEEENSWLLEVEELTGHIPLPEFVMEDQAVEDYRIANYSQLRSAAYDAVNQFELIADGSFDAHITSVKARFPKA